MVLQEPLIISIMFGFRSKSVPSSTKDTGFLIQGVLISNF